MKRCAEKNAKVSRLLIDFICNLITVIKLFAGKSCEITFYLTKWFKSSNKKIYNISYTHSIHSTNPSFSFLYIFFDILGLISLFFNISFYESCPQILKRLLIRYLRQFRSVILRFYWVLKLIIFILCLFCLIFMSVYLIIQYLKNEYQQLEGFDFPTHIIPFQLIICVPVQVLIDNQDKLDIEKEINLLRMNSFTELEKLTNFDRFEKGIHKMAIKYATREIEIKYKIDKNIVIFRSFNYPIDSHNNHSNFNFLLRCFRIDFDFSSLQNTHLKHYEILYSLSNLEFILDHNFYVVYPLSINHNLTSLEHNLIFDPYFSKTTVNKKTDCIHYKFKKYNCESKFECWDQCQNYLHLKKYKNLTIQSVVYKDKIKRPLDQVYFITYRDEEIFEKCKSKFTKKNCHADYFSISKDVKMNLKCKKFLMRLHYKHFTVIDNPVLTLPDLIFNNLFNFTCIFIGLNAKKLFSIIFVLLKRYRLSKTFELLKYTKILVCFLGFSAHLYFIFFNALTEDFIKIQEYSYPNILELPNLILCFEYDETKIDLNRRQTTDYLDQLTKELNLSFFKNISYLDENYDERIYTPYQQTFEKGLDHIHWFYFLNLKCFEFVFDKIKNDRFLYLLNSMNFVNFKFDKEKVLGYYNLSSSFDFYIISRKNNTEELNEMLKVNFKYYNDTKSSTILLNQILYTIKVEDKISFLRQPFSIFYDSIDLDDTTEYIRAIKRDLKKWNFKTKEIAMFGNEDHFEFDDEKFSQYFFQIKNVSDCNAFHSINYQREFFLSSMLTKEKSNDSDYDFKLFLNPFINTVRLKNRNSHSKFIIIELTCLNFYYNFGIFHLYLHMQNVLKLLLKFYYLILSLKTSLERSRDLFLLRRI